MKKKREEPAAIEGMFRAILKNATGIEILEPTHTQLASELMAEKGLATVVPEAWIEEFKNGKWIIVKKIKK